MKRSGRTITSTGTGSEIPPQSNGRGDVSANGHPNVSFAELSVILSSLQTMRDGDFSVRLPGNWTGCRRQNRGHV